MESTAIATFLKTRVELFAEFTTEQLDALVRESRVAMFEPNEAVIEFGEEGRFLGVVLEGDADVSVTDDGGDRHVLTAFHAGDVFNQMALMTGDKTVADVIASTRCQVLLIPQRLFSSLLAAHPSAVAILSKMMIERLRNAEQAGGRNEQALSALRRSEDPYGLLLRTDRPMKLLVINCGSSSLKYNLFDTANEAGNAQGSVERIGGEGTRLKHRSAKGESARDLPKAGHGEAFAAMVDVLTAPETGVLGAITDVSAVGHRVVHGGDQYSHSVVISDEVIKSIEAAAEFAPLHNPVNLVGIREAMRLLPQAPHVAVFDTAFHQNMPAYAYLYGLPYEFYEQKHIRRYGFHGTSHKYVGLKVAEHLKRPYNNLETIICHLGNGASVCAVDHGRSVDTSMGLTPTEGLLMGTRCGDVDPAVLIHLMKTEGMDAERLSKLINNESGLKGLSGVSNDMRAIEEAAANGNPRALIAIRTFAYRVRKYLGAYVAAMGGLDAIAFTGGIGQGSAIIRALACQGLDQMGICIDEQKNRDARGFERVCVISTDDSPVSILVVPTDEERMIARETLRAIDRRFVTEIIKSQAPLPIPIEISAHHVHLSQEHVEALFGVGHQLTPVSDLSQPGQFACQEKVTLIGPKNQIPNVRVLGPARKKTQVEISMTEQFKLGIDAPIRESGSIEGSPGITLGAGQATVQIHEGVICALRHIHMSPEDALRMGLKDKDVVRVRIDGGRELIFGDVLIRVHPDFRLAMHIDTDEGNAANIPGGATGHIDSIQSRR